jgi:isoquinoline 1-oxidoreductase alpha subunit
VPQYKFTVNGKQVSVDAPADMPLLWVLRDRLGITGPKYGCGIGACRACTSHLDGAEIQPCTVPVSDCRGKKVTTIEGLADGDELHPMQQAWIDQDVSQCGFCQPGQIMAAVALLEQTDKPTDAEIAAIENMCRCGTYLRIREAIKQAAGMPSAKPKDQQDRPEKSRRPKDELEKDPSKPDTAPAPAEAPEPSDGGPLIDIGIG